MLQAACSASNSRDGSLCVSPNYDQLNERVVRFSIVFRDPAQIEGSRSTYESFRVQLLEAARRLGYDPTEQSVRVHEALGYMRYGEAVLSLIACRDGADGSHRCRNTNYYFHDGKTDARRVELALRHTLFGDSEPTPIRACFGGWI